MQSPRFTAARRYGWQLLAIGSVFALLGGLLQALTVSAGVPRALGYLGAALWTAAAAFLSSALLSYARQRFFGHAGVTVEPATGAARGEKHIAAPDWTWRSTASALLARLNAWIRDPQLIGRWPPALISLLFATLSLIGIVLVWRASAAAAVSPLTLKLAGAALLLAAFPLLVLERSYAGIDPQLLPEGPQLERLLRVPLTACLALAASFFLQALAFAWAVRIEQVAAVVIAIVSLEVLLRSAVILFVPFAPIERRQALPDSTLAGAVLRLRPPSFRSINIAVRRQFGIDLSRSWALGFVQKAALPALIGIVLFAWAVTGVTALGIEQRGIYERFGVPVKVLGPGLHIHLPWPLGTVRPVEIGVVHLLPIEFLLPGAPEGKSSSVGGEEAQPTAPAEGPAPEGSDRLWSDNHPFEGNYLIASEENGRQSFQLVDIDMAVMYRVGLSEQAARDAAYRVADIDELIQALSGQLLVQYFTRNTLLDLLGKSRESFTRQFQSSLQEQLDRFSTGVQAIGVSVEAIHPPPGAAMAYHDVQAAQINSISRISLSRGDATRALKAAQQQAEAQHDVAVAAAAEQVAEAQSQGVLFGADRKGYAQDGYPFLLERWIESLVKGIGQSPFVLIDHRLAAQNMPALDLRNLGPASVNADLGPAPSSPGPSSTGSSSSQPAPAAGSADADDN